MKKEKGSKQKMDKQPFFERHPKLSNMWFWFTAWRPIIKYEHAGLTMNLLALADKQLGENKKIKQKINEIISHMRKSGDAPKDLNDKGMYG